MYGIISVTFYLLYELTIACIKGTPDNSFSRYEFDYRTNTVIGSITFIVIATRPQDFSRIYLLPPFRYLSITP